MVYPWRGMVSIGGVPPLYTWDLVLMLQRPKEYLSLTPDRITVTSIAPADQDYSSMHISAYIEVRDTLSSL